MSVVVFLGIIAVGCAGGSRDLPPTAAVQPAANAPAAIAWQVPPRPAFIDTAPEPALHAPASIRRTLAAHPSFFNGEIALSNGVSYLVLPNSTIFGYYSYLTDQRYIYHFDLGYEFTIDANDGRGGVYLYDFASSHWWYTGTQFPFPYVYDFTLNALLYYYPDTKNAGHYTTNPRYFFNFGTNAIVTLPASSPTPVPGTLSASWVGNGSFAASAPVAMATPSLTGSGYGGRIDFGAIGQSATVTLTQVGNSTTFGFNLGYFSAQVGTCTNNVSIAGGSPGVYVVTALAGNFNGCAIFFTGGTYGSSTFAELYYQVTGPSTLTGSAS